MKCYSASFLVILIASTGLFAQTECNLQSHTTFNFGPNSDDQLYHIEQLNDGKFLAFGTSYYISSNSFEINVGKFMPEEGMDTTFGINGRVQHKFDQRNTCYAGAVRSDGKIYAGGYQAPGNGVSSFRPYVARLLADGSVDSSFGTNGSALINAVGGGHIIGLIPKDSTKMLATCITRSQEFALIQLLDNGTLDSAFGNNGVAKHRVSNLAWQTVYGKTLLKQNGKIVFVGKTLVPTNPCIAQFNTDGSIDTSFANNGVLVISRGISYNGGNIHGTLDANDRIIVGGTVTSPPTCFGMWRVNQNGQLDTTFGVNGHSISKSYGFAQPRDIVVHPTTRNIIQLGANGTSNRHPGLYYTDENGQPIGGCNNDTLETITLGYASSHYFTNGVYDDLNNLRLFGISGKPEISGGSAENWNFMRMADECLNVSSQLSVDVCESYTSPSGNHTWTQSGIYFDTLTNPSQCNLDSILIIDLFVDSILADVSELSDTLIANTLDSTYQYQWINCDSANMTLPDDTLPFFVPNITGNYAVVMSNALCIDTSDCMYFEVKITDTTDTSNHILEMALSKIKLYPNPSRNVFYIESPYPTSELKFNITDLAGRRHDEYTIQRNEHVAEIQHDLTKGMYLLTISLKGGMKVLRLFVE